MRYIILCTLLAVTQILSVHGEEISFTASAPEAVINGQRFKLVYTVNADNSDVKNTFRAPEFEGFEVLMGPREGSSRSYQNINGKVTQEVTTMYTYVLMPQKEGTYTIPAASIKVKGSSYTSNDVTIKVLPPDQEDTSNNNSGTNNSSSSTQAASVNDKTVFMRAIVSTKEVYEQEPILVTYKLYTLSDLSLQNAKFPEFDGFLAQEVDLPDEKQWVLDNYNGRNYRSVVIKQTLLFPQRSGELTIPSGSFDLLVRVRNQQRTGSIFDDFFDSYTDTNKTITTETVKINVKPLPSGKPASFGGTVGNLNMTATANTSELKTNESLTIKVVFTGSGNLKLIKTPEVSFPADFDIYDPKVENSLKTTASTVSGKQTIEYLAIPRHAGDFVIPPIEYSYFDLSSNSYKTLKSDEFKIHVTQGEGGTDQSTVTSNFTSNKEDVKYLGKDIRYITVGNIKLKQKGDLFYGNSFYWLCYIAPLFLFIMFLIIYRKQAKENANMALMRTKKANKVATKRLKLANKYLKENNKEAYYEELMRALWGYVSDKMNIPLSKLTKDNVGSELVKFGADEQFINEFMDILNTCEFARYAPNSEENAMDKLYNRSVNVINKLESIIK